MIQQPQYLVGEDFVKSDHFIFYGHDFARMFSECVRERPYSLYTIPCYGDPRYPMITLYFSAQPWTHQQLTEFSEGNLSGLVQREKAGEGIIGFQYDLHALTNLKPLTRPAREFLPTTRVTYPR